MKVFGGCFDGRNRLIVASKTKKAAYEAIREACYGRLSYHGFSEFACETGNGTELSTALAAPGVVFSQDIRGWDNPFLPCTDTAQKRPTPTETSVNETGANRA